MLTEVLVASEFVSAALGLILVYFFTRVYRLIRFNYLLGLPVGFLFLSSSYVFLGFFLIFEGDASVSDLFLWLRLVSQTYGFSFIASSYYFSSKAGRVFEYLGIITLVSIVSVLLVFGALVFSPPFLEIPAARIVDEYFRVANLLFLGYTVYRVVRHLELPSKTKFGLWSPMAFSVLWLGQYSLLIWGIDGSQVAFVLAHVARLVSLVLFVSIYYSSGRAS